MTMAELDKSTDLLFTVFESENEGFQISSPDLAKRVGVDHQQLVDSVLKSLLTRDILNATSISHQIVVLSDEGKEYEKAGSPEAQLFRKIQESGKPEGLTKDEVEQLLGKETAKVAMANALKNKWLVLDKDTKTLKCAVLSIEDEIGTLLKKVAAISLDATECSGLGDLNEADVKSLKQRKLIQVKTQKTFEITRGLRFADARKAEATELTFEMMQSGSWAEMAFKPYNFDAEGKVPEFGCLHPLLKVREQFRMIFVRMGFEEMPTDNYVESSFWNFDALFQPQQHPARDAHDTFFLSKPSTAKISDQEYMARVKTVHEVGGFGSLGYRYRWNEDEAKKNILRTHTTAVSSRMLYLLAKDCEKDGVFRPKKYFSIDRVFRNETLDATHLAEFHQVEGLVAAPGLSLADLKGVIAEFFERMGMTKLRFKPAHNPYTEPSMEIFSFHEGLNRWVEVGNSGIFRPEMLRPMGLPEGVRVIAWGLSLERPTMIMYGIKNIRDLFGHKVNLGSIMANPICRLGM